MGNITQQKRRLDTSSAESSDNLAEADVQLAWGYVLRQLRQVGSQHAQWHLHDTSSSGLTGHSGKVDYCMTADRLKAWPQVVALVELKKEIDSASLYGECIGQLSARTIDLFDEQPNRKHVVVIAGGSHSLEVLQFKRTFEVVRSGKQLFSLDATSAGFRWLIKALCSSLPSMGFIPAMLPFNGRTPAGYPIQKGLCCRADTTTSAGLGLCCKVFQAEYDVGQHPVAVKIGASTKREAELLEHLARTVVTGIPEVMEHGTLPGDVSYIITKPFGALLAIHDATSLIVSVISKIAAIIHQLASLVTPVLHRDISIGNTIYHGDAHMAYLNDFGAAVKAPTGCFTAVTEHSITGTGTYMARSVLGRRTLFCVIRARKSHVCHGFSSSKWQCSLGQQANWGSGTGFQGAKLW